MLPYEAAVPPPSVGAFSISNVESLQPAAVAAAAHPPAPDPTTMMSNVSVMPLFFLFDFQPVRIIA